MKAKPKPCSFCGKISPLWKSNPATCHACARKQATTEAIERSKGEHNHKGLTASEDGKEARVFKYQTSNHKKAKSLTVDQIREKKELDEFFELQADQVPEHCENCGGKLNAFNKWAKKCVTAHILPKNDNAFPSVKAHPMNRMFLGKGIFSECNCHDLWDWRDAEARKQMHCYDKAVERVESFYDELTPHEQNMADKYLGIESRLSKAI
jgi:hypothetical protein